MNIFYSLREACSGFAKARISALITVFTVFFLLLFLAIVAVLSLNMNRLVNVLNANHDLHVFLANTLTDVEIDQLSKELSDLEGVVDLDYISKEKAAAEFKKEFGDDIFDALEENPLPASFIIKLDEGSKMRISVDDFANNLERMPEIDQVLLHRGALNVLVKFSSVSRVVLYLLFFVVFIGSLFMISNTIRLIIFARRQIIETMKLVGATDSFIRRPFLFEGIFQGLLGGTITVVAIYLLVKIIDLQWPGFVVVPQELYIIIVLSGILFGLIGSLFAIRRFL